jgi:aspartyl-tRNA synthetase
MKTIYREAMCAEIVKKKIGQQITLTGWVHKVRDLGGVLFVDLRDRSGLAQVIFDPVAQPKVYQLAKKTKSEWIIQVKGKIRKRESVNKEMLTGELEIVAEELVVLNEAKVPIFSIAEEQEVDEITKLKYRYLELRKPLMNKRLMLRHRIKHCIHNYLDKQGFLDIETPFLTKSTPEGARDYLVPSRIYKGCFYALPQSPQLFKQMLMMSGFDRYYQIVKCFRDEDLRADRQPEFTQVDIEMSFVGQSDVQKMINGLLKAIFKVIDFDIKEIKSMTFDDAMANYGSDKPDLRFDLAFKEITDIESGFEVFKSVVKNKGVIKGIRLPGGVSLLSRKKIEDLEKLVKAKGAKGLAWFHIKDDNALSSPIAKFFSEEQLRRIQKRFGAKINDTLLLIADKDVMLVNTVLGDLRLKLNEMFQLAKEQFSFLWVTDFPLFEKTTDTHGLTSMHHPFTSPKLEDLELLEKEPLRVRSNAYDIVLNGVEIGGGSVRIHNWDLQKTIFRLLGLSKEQIEMKFGFFVEALKYGTPPHGGIALGLDRLVMMMAGVNSIREVIAFPKTTNAACPLTAAPSQVSMEQLKELGLCLK